MLSVLLTSLCFSIALQSYPSTASPLQKRVDNTQPSGTNAVTSFHIDPLGMQTSANSCSNRDLGFTGEIAGTWYAVYGDTNWCAPGVTDPTKDDTSKFNGMVRDSIARMTNDVLHPVDLNLNAGQRPQQLIPFNASWGESVEFGFGGTSICETDASQNQGIVFYAVASLTLPPFSPQTTY